MEMDQMRLGVAEIKARQVVRGLRDLRQAIGIAQAALVMATEGVSRATAAEVAERAGRDFETSVTASHVGHLLRQFGISSAITHGKSRLVLDPDVLKAIRDNLAKASADKAAEVEKVLAVFNTVSVNVKALEERWQQVLRLRAKEQVLAQRLQEESAKPSRSPELERRLAALQDEANKAAALEAQCRQLQEKLEALPSLRACWDSLDERMWRYRQEEQQVVADEARLGQALVDLKMRSAWVTYVDLDSNIQRQKAELEELSQQLGEKRSLLQRMFGTSKGR